MNCPNPQCKIAGISDEAKFSPNCGALLEKAKNVEIQSRTVSDEEKKSKDSHQKKYYTFDELYKDKKILIVFLTVLAVVLFSYLMQDILQHYI